MENKTEELMQALADSSKVFIAAMKEIEDEQEEFWNSLTPDQQIMCFCAVSRRIHKGEIEDRGSYRWVLYDVFGFGPEAYAQAQDAGYLAIHNSIMCPDEERRLLLEFAKKSGYVDPEQAVTEFYKGNL